MKWIVIVVSIWFCSCIGLSQNNHKYNKVLITFIQDGDTYSTSEGEWIRLKDADCPEISHKVGVPSQMYANEAYGYSYMQLMNREVGIVRHGKDNHGRTLASVTLEGGRDLATELVKRGMAHVNPRYCNNQALLREYYTAIQNRVGLFQYPYIYPSQWRKQFKKY